MLAGKFYMLLHIYIPLPTFIEHLLCGKHQAEFNGANKEEKQNAAPKKSIEGSGGDN